MARIKSEKPKEIKIEYTCAAFPPSCVDVKLNYIFGKEEDKFYFSSSNDEKDRVYADIWFIKMLFTPVNSSWDKVLKDI